MHINRQFLSFTGVEDILTIPSILIMHYQMPEIRAVNSMHLNFGFICKVYTLVQITCTTLIFLDFPSWGLPPNPPKKCPSWNWNLFQFCQRKSMKSNWNFVTSSNWPHFVGKGDRYHFDIFVLPHRALLNQLPSTLSWFHYTHTPTQAPSHNSESYV